MSGYRDVERPLNKDRDMVGRTNTDTPLCTEKSAKSNIHIKHYIPSVIPIEGLHTVASNETRHTKKGQSAFIEALSSKNDRLEWARTTPCNAGMYLREKSVD